MRPLLVVTAVALVACQTATPIDPARSLAGTWTLVAAERELLDGSRVPDYGAHPSGRLTIDADGRYSLRIFSAERRNFASGDKATGTDAETRQAVLGASTHYGAIVLRNGVL